MFGQSKPVVLQPYGRRSGGWRIPGWLILLLIGIAIGAAGVIVLQERYLPPRLSAAASSELKHDFETAETERLRLGRDLAEATRQLEATRAEQLQLTQELSSSQDTVASLREDVAGVVSALPLDPRGGPVAVRAARFATDDGRLAYDIVLSRERASSVPFTGVLQFVVAGQSPRGARSTVGLKPVTISIERHASLKGSVELPEGFQPRQATVNVLDKVDGRTFGRRVFNLR